MNISELKNKNIAQYRKKVKIAALKAAEDKAKYLLASIGKQIGEIISYFSIYNRLLLNILYVINQKYGLNL